ncbi:MAG: S66 peptidase family protein [bacterium]|jgi:muramoyltetrapeptide carboxypeptidase
MRKVKRLRPGETVGIVSPSSRPEPEKLNRGAAYLESRGYRVVLGEHVLDSRAYLAGRDEDRAADLNELFGRKDIAAILCAQGGYGSLRTLRYLDWNVIRANPKIFLGYSDITGFHCAFRQEAGFVTFHGPMVAHEMGGEFTSYTDDHLWRAVAGAEPVGVIENPPDGPPVQVITEGTVTGELVGGNLSLIAALMGTPYELETRGKILFLEDVGEAPYRYDRYLMHLWQAGKLQSAAGIVIGESVDCVPTDPASPTLTLTEVFDDLIKPLNIPAIYGLCCGHGRHKATLPLGVQATLAAGEKKLIIEESGVE